MNEEQVIWFNRELGAPVVTIAEYGIVFNRAAVETLGIPEHVVLGIDPKNRALVAKAAEQGKKSESFPFAARQREVDGTVRISHRDFIRLLRRHIDMDLTRAIRCIAVYDEATGILTAKIPDAQETLGITTGEKEKGNGDWRSSQNERD